MSANYGDAGFGGVLETKLIRAPKPHKVRWLRIPGFGRVAFTRDPGTGFHWGSDAMESHLWARHVDGDGKLVNEHDLGSGNVQSNFVVALMEDQQGTTTNHAAPILANSNKYMYSGTGVTANTYDFQLGTSINTPSALISPTLGFAANGTAGTDGSLQYVGTINYAGTFAVTEWGLFNTNSQGSQTNATTDTFTATTVAGNTWNTALVANAYAGYVVVVTGTPVAGYILANTAANTGTLTIGTGWYNLTAGGGAGTTPTANTAANIYPLMSDHKAFAAINVVSGDSIQFTYTLKLVAGG